MCSALFAEGAFMKETEDRRIQRTRRSLKEAIVKLMEKKSFEKITVKEICEEALTSRITFYNYYSDKYALLDEVIEDLNKELEERFRQLQKNNTDDDPVLGYQNLADCFLSIRYAYDAIFSNVSMESNTILVPAYYRFMIDRTADLVRAYADRLRPAYPPEQISTFLVGGMYSYVIYARKHGVSFEDMRRQVHGMMVDLIGSNMYTAVGTGRDKDE
jgi:AcrR family transcriptional regulator